MKIKVTCSVLLAWGVCAALPRFSAAADNAVKAEFMLRGILSERAKIHSGVFRIKGFKRTRHREAPENDMEGNVEIFGAFDQGRNRWDSSQPGWVFDKSSLRTDPAAAGGPTLIGGASEKGVVARKTLRTPTKSASWVVGEPNMGLNGPDAPFLGEGILFDIRALGATSWIEITRGRKLEDLINAYLKNNAIKNVDDSDRNLVELSFLWDERPTSSSWRLWVAPTEGFTVVRSEFQERGGNADAAWTVTQAFRTDWKEINDVWVPVHHEMSVRTPTGNRQEEMEFGIDWESVNQPVDPQLFDYASFGAPDTVAVIDLSLGRAIEISSGRQGATTPSQAGVSFRTALVGLNVLLIIALLGYAIYRRRSIASRQKQQL